MPIGVRNGINNLPNANKTRKQNNTSIAWNQAGLFISTNDITTSNKIIHIANNGNTTTKRSGDWLKALKVLNAMINATNKTINEMAYR